MFGLWKWSSLYLIYHEYSTIHSFIHSFIAICCINPTFRHSVILSLQQLFFFHHLRQRKKITSDHHPTAWRPRNIRTLLHDAKTPCLIIPKSLAAIPRWANPPDAPKAPKKWTCPKVLGFYNFLYMVSILGRITGLPCFAIVSEVCRCSPTPLLPRMRATYGCGLNMFAAFAHHRSRISFHIIKSLLGANADAFSLPLQKMRLTLKPWNPETRNPNPRRTKTLNP